MDKSALRTAILHQLKLELARQTQAALASHEDATHEENRAENKYDMHAQEAAYLAEGQARLVSELRESLIHFSSLTLPSYSGSDPVALGALVTLKGRTTTLACFVGPRAGGMEVAHAGQTVLVVTPASPLGRQLIGRRAGESVHLPGPDGGAHIITGVA